MRWLQFLQAGQGREGGYVTQRLSVRIHRATHWEVYGKFVQFLRRHTETHITFKLLMFPGLISRVFPKSFSWKCLNYFFPPLCLSREHLQEKEDLWSGSCRSNTHQQQLSHMKGPVYSVSVCVCVCEDRGWARANITKSEAVGQSEGTTGRSAQKEGSCHQRWVLRPQL